MPSSCLMQLTPSYLGNRKDELVFLEECVEAIKESDPLLSNRIRQKQSCIVDLFAGSGSISLFFRELGCIVHANDHNGYTNLWLDALISLRPNNLMADLYKWADTQNLSPTLKQWHQYFLDSIRPQKGHTYSWLAEGHVFFSEANSLFYDGCFALLETLESYPALKRLYTLLVVKTMLDSVNSPGTFKSSFSSFESLNNTRRQQALQYPVLPFMELRSINDMPAGVTYHQDALQMSYLFGDKYFDIAVIDPPYSTLQYRSAYSKLDGIKNTNSFPSMFSKVSSVEYAWAHLIKEWTPKTRWMLVLYPDNGLLPIDTLMMMLHQYGQNKVSVVSKQYVVKNGTNIRKNNKFALLVQTNTWQSPTEIQQAIRSWRGLQNTITKEDTYVEPSKLSKKVFHSKPTKLGWTISVNEHFFAEIHHTRKVVSCSDYVLTYVQEQLWNSAVLNDQQLFLIYLAEKKWAKALKILRKFKKQKHSLFRSNVHRMLSASTLRGYIQYSTLLKEWLDESR